MSFETRAGIIDAEVTGETVKLRLTDPKDLRKAYTIDLDGAPTLVNSINTGVPHVVAFVNDVDGHDVFNMGRTIRYHGEYRPAGTNANFARVLGRHRIRLRTYERGVEDETLACGTGAVATALLASWAVQATLPVDIVTRSGRILGISATLSGPMATNVWLSGEGRLVFTVEALGAGRADDHVLQSNGRYAHGEHYLRRVLAASGFGEPRLRRETLRLEAGEPVAGWLVSARARGG